MYVINNGLKGQIKRQLAGPFILTCSHSRHVGNKNILRLRDDTSVRRVDKKIAAMF